MGVLVLRHAESAPAEEVGDPLKPDSFCRALLGLPCWPHLAAMTCIRPGECSVCQESIRDPRLDLLRWQQQPGAAEAGEEAVAGAFGPMDMDRLDGALS